MAYLGFLVCTFAFAVVVIECAYVQQKRNFVSLGCMGTFDRSKYALLDTVCEECYELYREPDLHSSCKQNCFKNEYFNKCIQALLREDEEEDLLKAVDLLYGKRK